MKLLKYRGAEYTVVQTLPGGWRWSVQRGAYEKSGTASSFESSVMLVKRLVDNLISLRRETTK
jgi:hypothetical protein